MKKIILLIVFFFFAAWSGLYFLKKGQHNGTRHAYEWLDNDEAEGAHGEEEKKVDQPDKFLQFHRGIRTRDGESSPSYPSGYKWEALKDSRYQLARKRSSGARTKSNGVLEWKERGPGNVPGRTRALYNIPGDPTNNTWLAGAATGGIWRSNNGGNTWSERSADFPAMPISSFAADANATVIYAGTGEYVSSVFSAMGNGIFKSLDKGETWTQLPATNNHPDFSIITRLIVNPSNADVIVASTVPHNLALDNTSAIMRSSDGGVSWTKVKEITGIFEQIIATPANFNIQYASQRDVGVWKSIDAGVTWNLSNTGMSTTGRVEIAVSPVNPNKLFASSEGTLSGTESDLFFSNDAAVTWSLVDVRFNNTPLDFFEGQGFYDNTIMCDPFDENKVYFGGVSLFRSTVASGSSTIDFFHIVESATTSFLFLQSFANILHDNARLTLGGFHNGTTVEVRFGPGKSQKAHRFLVPASATSGVLSMDYAYQDYIAVPFEVWDVTSNPARQLMVSFRDQNRNNKFDLIPSGFPDGSPLSHSREYFYVNNVDYAASPNNSITTAGGHEFRMMYNFFPALAAGASWNEANLPESKLIIKNDPIDKITSSTVTVADGRGAFDNKNKSNQITLSLGVHPDHHYMIPLIMNAGTQTYRILEGSDGGVFVSKTSTDPGVTEGDWEFKGHGYNTSQFYGADKKPGADEYIGGMQDNGTRFSPEGQVASPNTSYIYAIGGDGFEVLWNSKDPSRVMGSVYYGQISRSNNGGTTWAAATNGFFPGADEFSFITKLANSKDYPDRVFTAGVQGVYVSQNFGGQWSLTPIAEKFILNTPFYLDVEVSRANPNIVWAGSGMNNTGTLRNLHVSMDGGKTFTATTNFTTVPLGNITKLASHPTEPNTAYAIFSFADAPKILRTTNLGASWEDISGFGSGTSSTNGFPDVAVYCLYVRPDDPDILWAGTEIGIVESTDNGVSWTLLNDFPNVSVWDMKGQDDQVVVATHGRGIWTATIDQPQTVSKAAEIIASGPSPQEKLVLRIQSLQNFDSVQIFIGGTLVKKINSVTPGTFDTDLISTPGQKDIQMICFAGAIPYQSSLHRMQNFDILQPANSYSNYFTSLSEVSVQGMALRSFPGETPQHRDVLQSEHDYLINKDYKLFINTPVTVSASSSTLFYRDIAITEPGNDSVVVEATKNGIDWVRLAPSHDASFDSQWQSAYSGAQAGTSSMFVKHELDIRDTFSAGDLLLFRLRLISGPSVTSWGWALDYVSIQEQPVSVEGSYSAEALTLYPNPSSGKFTLEYALNKASPVALQVLDIYGRSIGSKSFGLRNAGLNREAIDVEGTSSGTYLLVLQTEEGKKTRKISIVR